MLLPRAMKATTSDVVEVVCSCLSEVCLPVVEVVSSGGSFVGVLTGAGVPQLIKISSECSSSLVSV